MNSKDWMPLMMLGHDSHAVRLELIENTITRQKAFLLKQMPPDQRNQAEANLITLVGMREALEPRRGEAPQSA